MNPLLKDYFTFSKRERRGAFLLMMIIFLLLFAPVAIQYYHDHFVVKEDYSAIDASIIDFLKKKEALNASLKVEDDKNEFYQKPDYFYFNPNHTSAQDYERLGLKPKLIKTIQNFLSKGGRFYKKEDFKKMYGMSEDTYNALFPYIILDEKPLNRRPSFEQSNKHIPEKVNKVIMIEINEADSIELLKIKGIGESFASRIVKYKNKLGGFVSKEQLLEIYSFDSDKLAEIEGQISINPLLIKKININSCTYVDLVKHPYVEKNIANAIIRIREQHGLYAHISEIQRSDLVNDELYRKLAPYLTIE
jgi:competence protein ComEA